MTPQLSRMRKVIVEHPNAAHFIVSPYVAKQLLYELTPRWMHERQPSDPPQPREWKVQFMGRDVFISPGLRDGDFFPVYTSSLTNIFQQLDSKEPS